jgi:hypothetical protein
MILFNLLLHPRAEYLTLWQPDFLKPSQAPGLTTEQQILSHSQSRKASRQLLDRSLPLIRDPGRHVSCTVQFGGDPRSHNRPVGLSTATPAPEEVSHSFVQTIHSTCHRLSPYSGPGLGLSS